MNEFLTMKNFIPSLTIAQRYPWIAYAIVYVIIALFVCLFASLLNGKICMSISDAEEWYDLKRRQADV